MPLTRRQFLRRAFWSATALAAGGTGYGLLIEPHQPEITRHNVRLPDWPPALDGLTIAHLTDLHRSSLVSRQYLEDCIRQVNALAPHLIALTGDYLTHGRSPTGRLLYGTAQEAGRLLDDVAECLAQLRAPLGVFACLGNHDHWYDAGAVTSALRHAGLSVLRNTHLTLHHAGATLALVGLGDLWTEGVHFHRAFAGLDDQPTLVLMHNPDSFETWPRSGRHLILAGHTHGGQVRLPGLGAPIVPSRYGPKYAHGWFRRDDTLMYVNRGLGRIWPGLRLNCRPEIALLTLHSA